MDFSEVPNELLADAYYHLVSLQDDIEAMGVNTSEGDRLAQIHVYMQEEARNRKGLDEHEIVGRARK